MVFAEVLAIFALSSKEMNSSEVRVRVVVTPLLFRIL